MAIYRFEAKVISRSGARSAVASAAYRTGKCATSAAAYRAGAKLTDERTGQSYDYTNKSGVAGAEILTPDGAPDWMRDRERLWNAVEEVEKRKDAQLARDFIISLPHELSAEQREALTRDFVREQFCARGYVADVAWHSPDRGEGLNHHAHVMVPMRKVEGDGFARTKERPPDGEHPAKAWRNELGHLREEWANTANRHLEAAGLGVRIDHRSLVDRGLDRDPEPKQGPLATEIERQGRASLAGEERRAVKARNAEREVLKYEYVEFEILVARQRAAEADLARRRAFLAEAKALGLSPAELAQDKRNERHQAWANSRQEAWRVRVEENNPQPRGLRAAKEVGLRVVDNATGAVSKLGDFMLDLLAGSSPPAQEKPADMRAFATDPQARKEQQLAQVAAYDAAERDQKAAERIADDMKAGNALSSSDIKALTPAHQMQIKNFGDDGVRQMVDEAQKRAQQYWKDGGREREF